MKIFTILSLLLLPAFAYASGAAVWHTLMMNEAAQQQRLKEEQDKDVATGKDNAASFSSELTFPSDIYFNNGNGKTIMVIRGKTGTLEKGEAFNDKDKASREIFDALAKVFPAWKEGLKQQ